VEVRGQGNVTYHFHLHALAQQAAANVFLTQSRGYTRLLSSVVCTARQGGRAVAYPYVSQLYRTRLDVVLAGYVTSVARIGRHYEF